MKKNTKKSKKIEQKLNDSCMIPGKLLSNTLWSSSSERNKNIQSVIEWIKKCNSGMHEIHYSMCDENIWEQTKVRMTIFYKRWCWLICFVVSVVRRRWINSIERQSIKVSILFQSISRLTFPSCPRCLPVDESVVNQLLPCSVELDLT